MEIRTKSFEGERLLKHSSLAFLDRFEKYFFKYIWYKKQTNFKNKDWSAYLRMYFRLFLKYYLFKGILT